MVHPINLFVFGLAIISITIGLAIAAAVFDGLAAAKFAGILLVPFVAFGAYIILEYLMVRHQISNWRLVFRRVTGTKVSVAWADVTQVKYSKRMKRFKIRTFTGDVVRVSAGLIGLEEFSRVVLANVKPTAIDQKTKEVLDSAAVGDLPRLR